MEPFRVLSIIFIPKYVWIKCKMDYYICNILKVLMNILKLISPLAGTYTWHCRMSYPCMAEVQLITLFWNSLPCRFPSTKSSFCRSEKTPAKGSLISGKQNPPEVASAGQPENQVDLVSLWVNTSFHLQNPLFIEPLK